MDTAHRSYISGPRMPRVARDLLVMSGIPRHAGAGGSTSELTVELCTNAKAKFGLDVNMHMTCTNQPAVKVRPGTLTCTVTSAGRSHLWRADSRDTTPPTRRSHP
jgi:hypothetical protein